MSCCSGSQHLHCILGPRRFVCTLTPCLYPRQRKEGKEEGKVHALPFQCMALNLCRSLLPTSHCTHLVQRSLVIWPSSGLPCAQPKLGYSRRREWILGHSWHSVKTFQGFFTASCRPPNILPFLHRTTLGGWLQGFRKGSCHCSQLV